MDIKTTKTSNNLILIVLVINLNQKIYSMTKKNIQYILVRYYIKIKSFY